MKIQTKFDIGSRVRVSMDGGQYIGVINSLYVTIVPSSADPLITYAGTARTTLKDADNKNKIFERTFMKREDELTGVNEHADTRQGDTPQADETPTQDKSISF